MYFLGCVIHPHFAHCIFLLFYQKGKQMHYDFGRYLRERYSGYLSPAYSQKEIFVQSSDADRAIMSAMSNMAGLWPTNSQDPRSEWSTGTPKVNWQPIPIHTIPKKYDNVSIAINRGIQLVITAWIQIRSHCYSSSTLVPHVPDLRNWKRSTLWIRHSQNPLTKIQRMPNYANTSLRKLASMNATLKLCPTSGTLCVFR